MTDTLKDHLDEIRRHLVETRKRLDMCEQEFLDMRRLVEEMERTVVVFGNTPMAVVTAAEVKCIRSDPNIGTPLPRMKRET